MQIFKKIFWTDLWPIFNTFFFPAWVDSPSLSNGSGDNFFQRTARAVRADNNFFFFCERIACVTRRITWHFFFERIARAVHVIYANKLWTTCSTRHFAVSSCHFVVSSRRLVAPVSSFPCFDLSLDKSFRLFEVLFRCFVSPIWLR